MTSLPNSESKVNEPRSGANQHPNRGGYAKPSTCASHPVSSLLDIDKIQLAIFDNEAVVIDYDTRSI